MPRIGQTSSPYQLYNCDCFELFAKLKSQSVDLVLVDPPYGTTGCKWDSVIPLAPMWKEIERVLKPRAAVLVFSSQPFSSLVVASNLNWYKYSWIWEKPQGANFLNFKFQPSKVHEEILVFGDGATSFSKLGNNLAYYPIMEQGDPYHIKKHGVGNAVARDAKTRNNKTIETINSGTRYPKSVLKYALDRSGWHPTLKPVDLVGYLVKTYSRPGGLVLDFAMGSGTTGVACGRLGRRFIGCDNDVEHGYFETAQRRIKEAYGA